MKPRNHRLCSYEDNFDQVNHFLVISEKTSAANIESFGGPEKFLEKYSFLLGKQAFDGERAESGPAGLLPRHCIRCAAR